MAEKISDKEKKRSRWWDLAIAVGIIAVGAEIAF